MEALTQQQKKALKGLAHHLNPCVQIGKGGLSDAVKATIVRALADHELIKVQLLDAAELDRKADSQSIAEAVGAELVQVIGFKVVLYRYSPDRPIHVL